MSGVWGVWQAFDEQPHLQLLKEMLVQAFATPKRHPRSKPFLDHVLAFSVADGRIWLRNYQARARQLPLACLATRCMPSHMRSICRHDQASVTRLQ